MAQARLTFTSGGVSYDLLVTFAGGATSGQAIGISGTAGSTNVTGLDSFFASDNIVNATAPYFTNNGLSFITDGPANQNQYNIYAASNGLYDFYREVPGGTATTQVATVSYTAASNSSPTASNLTQTLGYSEDAPSVDVNNIVVSDADSGDTITATLTVNNTASGTLTTGTFGAATSSYNTTSGAWTVTGSVTDVNAALAAVSFTPAVNFNGTSTITTQIRDGAGTGPVNGTITLNGAAVNDAPDVNVPAGLSGNTNTAIPVTGLLFSDVDGNGGSETVTFTSSNGILTANSVAGVTIGGGGSGTSSLTLSGTISALNTYIANSNLTDTGATNHSISVVINDNGNTGGGSLTSATKNIPVTIVVPPSITIDDVTHAEGNSGTTAYTFTVNLSAASAQTVSVNFATADGTALAGSDYTTNSGTVTFTPGQTTKTITVLANGDTVFENNQTFALNLSGATNATIADSQGIGTITNDDAAPTLAINDVAVSESGGPLTFTVTRTGATEVPITVEYDTADGSAVATAGGPGTPDYDAASGTLTFAPSLAATATQTFTVQVPNDPVYEAVEQFAVNLSGATGATIADAQGVGTVTNDDPAPTIAVNDVTVNENGTATFTVTLTGATALPIAVDYATADGTAVVAAGGPGTPDYASTSGTLTFNPSASGTQTLTITVPFTDDATNEATEQFAINLSNPTNGATLADAQGVATVVDDDAVPTISVTDVTRAEDNSGTTSFIFTVTLSAASAQTATVNYATADITTAAGSDYAAASGTLTFAPGETTKTVTVLVNGDTGFETDETFAVNLSGATNATIADSQGVGTIQNDDPAPSVTISSDVATLRGGQTAAITFSFSQDPGASFVDGDIVVSGGTLGPVSGSGLIRTATFVPTPNTDNGIASITVAAASYTDTAGNPGGAGTSPSLTFDTLAPGAPIVGTIVDHGTYFDVIGGAEAQTTVAIGDSNPAVVPFSTTTGGTTQFAAASTSPLADGNHAFTVVASDAAGNASPPAVASLVVVQAANQLAFSNTSFTIAEDSALTRLVLNGGGLTGTGNSLGNELHSVETAASQINTLIGGAGNDLLVGGIGADILQGGGGNDVYAVYNSATAIADSSGTDLAYAYGVSFALTNADGIETLVMTGSGLTGTGHATTATNLYSVETTTSSVNTLIGGTGADLLVGGIGTDILQGGGGNDVYAVYNSTAAIGDSGGTDLLYAYGVNFSLAANDGIDTLLVVGTGLTGTGHATTATNLYSVETSAGDVNTLIGGTGADLLVGGIGADILLGNGGNDTYVVYNAATTISDTGGSDTAYAYGVSYAATAANGLETLVVTGNGLTGTGNAATATNLYSVETSAGDVNTLIGGTGADLLVGGIGADILQGGGGNDIYAVYNSATAIADTAGSDVAYAYGVNYQLADNSGVEALVLTGNGLTGTGSSGNDSLYSVGTGNTLTGGSAGNDSFFFDTLTTGANVVTGFEVHGSSANGDLIVLQNFIDTNFAAAQANNHIYQSGNDVIVADASNTIVTLQNIQLASLNASDFYFA